MKLKLPELTMKVQITITPEMGWVAFSKDGNVAGSSNDIRTVHATTQQMNWCIVSHVSGIPDWH